MTGPAMHLALQNLELLLELQRVLHAIRCRDHVDHRTRSFRLVLHQILLGPFHSLLRLRQSAAAGPLVRHRNRLSFHIRAEFGWKRSGWFTCSTRRDAPVDRFGLWRAEERRRGQGHAGSCLVAVEAPKRLLKPHERVPVLR